MQSQLLDIESLKSIYDVRFRQALLYSLSFQLC